MTGRDKSPGLDPGRGTRTCSELELDVGPYLPVEPLYKGLTILIALLVVADPPKLLLGEAVEPARDRGDVHLVVALDRQPAVRPAPGRALRPEGRHPRDAAGTFLEPLPAEAN